MKIKLLTATVLTALSVHAGDNTASIATGEKVSAALIQKLGGELKSVMAAHGPVAALGFCSANAIKLTKEVSDTSGYKVKRISLKERNPSNHATAQEITLLKEFESLVNAKQPLPPYILKTTKEGDRFYKPVVINNEACLKCHGAVDPSSELGQAIQAAYPHDKATGYKMGDLRGMIVVEIPQEIAN